MWLSDPISQRELAPGTRIAKEQQDDPLIHIIQAGNEAEYYRLIEVDLDKRVTALFGNSAPNQGYIPLQARRALVPGDIRSVGTAGILHSPLLSKTRWHWDEWVDREILSPPSILQQARVYVCACKPERIRKIPEQLEKLDLPYIIERELPNPDGTHDKAHLDNCSRRFRQQVITHTDRLLLWLEDDIDIPDNFLEVWTEYEKTLPTDWHVAVPGWGAIYCDGGDQTARIRKVSPGWWHLTRGGSYGVFGGAQAVLVNRGQWRMGLSEKIFRCDVELCKVLHEIGITQIYHTDKTLIGTNDPHSVFGNLSVMYPTMQEPKYWSWAKMEWRDVQEGDYVSG